MSIVCFKLNKDQKRGFKKRKQPFSGPMTDNTVFTITANLMALQQENNIDEIKSLEYLTGEQKDFILMHFQLFEGSVSNHLRDDYSESKDFNFGQTIGRNGPHNSLSVEKDVDGGIKSIIYSRKRFLRLWIFFTVMQWKAAPQDGFHLQ